jgi:hypothetical protein
VIVGEPIDELMAIAAEVFRRHERPYKAWGKLASLLPRFKSTGSITENERHRRKACAIGGAGSFIKLS